MLTKLYHAASMRTGKERFVYTTQTGFVVHERGDNVMTHMCVAKSKRSNVEAMLVTKVIKSRQTFRCKKKEKKKHRDLWHA